MAQVYVSYSRKDRETVLPIIKAMDRAGLDLWHDDEALSPSSSIREKMQRELDKALCVIVLWSKAAAQSQWVQWEIHNAIQAWSTDRLVLAALDDTPLPVGLRDLSPISIREASDSGTKQLIERAQAIIFEAQWRQIAVEGPESLHAYLDAFPSGRIAEAARARLAELEKIEAKARRAEALSPARP